MFCVQRLIYKFHTPINFEIKPIFLTSLFDFVLQHAYYGLLLQLIDIFLTHYTIFQVVNLMY